MTRGAAVNDQYYAGGSGLAELIADPSVDIHEVVREVERLCDREAHASKYYRENPHLQYAGHPWMKFVASGAATHLGWYNDTEEGMTCADSSHQG
jgi:hypothetical protein